MRARSESAEVVRTGRPAVSGLNQAYWKRNASKRGILALRSKTSHGKMRSSFVAKATRRKKHNKQDEHPLKCSLCLLLIMMIIMMLSPWFFKTQLHGLLSLPSKPRPCSRTGEIPRFHAQSRNPSKTLMHNQNKQLKKYENALCSESAEVVRDYY